MFVSRLGADLYPQRLGNAAPKVIADHRAALAKTN
jgi:hypothetical protein